MSTTHDAEMESGERQNLTDNPLSEREMEVARLLATGASNSEIARSLVISPHTVKVHLRNIFEKLQVSSRTEASMLLVQRGWLTVPGVVLAPEPGTAASSAPEQSVTEQPLPPDPPPLADLPPTVFGWQRVVFALALVIGLGMLIAPYWRSQARTSPPLLSDASARGETPQIVLEPRWEARTPLPAPRSRLAAVQIGELLYVMGGETTGGRLLRSLEAIDLRVNRWRGLSQLPAATSNLAAAALGDFIYVAGGNQAPKETNGEPVFSDKLWRYSLANDRWEEYGVLPHPLAGAALAADGASLYLIGGWDGKTMHDEVWKLTPAVASTAVHWELLTRLATPRAFLGAIMFGDDLYVAGGFDGQRELADAAAFDLESREWRTLPAMTNARSGHALVSDGLAIFALGGGWLVPVNEHERYDPAIDVWSNFPSPIANEWRHLAATAQDGQVFVLGGWSGDYLDANLQYQSSFRALLPVITND